MTSVIQIGTYDKEKTDSLTNNGCTDRKSISVDIL